MRQKYRDRRTERFAQGARVNEFAAIEKQAVRKLRLIEAATSLNDLRNPPSNHFKALQGDRAGQYSVRINEQWRICFRWSDETQEAIDIEIVDDH
jgi:proteic killer suppression protein